MQSPLLYALQNSLKYLRMYLSSTFILVLVSLLFCSHFLEMSFWMLISLK